MSTGIENFETLQKLIKLAKDIKAVLERGTFFNMSKEEDLASCDSWINTVDNFFEQYYSEDTKNSFLSYAISSIPDLENIAKNNSKANRALADFKRFIENPSYGNYVGLQNAVASISHSPIIHTNDEERETKHEEAYRRCILTLSISNDNN